MEAVADQLDGDARILDRRRNRTGLAMVQTIHRVEHMRHQAGAFVEGAAGGLVVGIAMADRGHGTGGREAADGLEPVRQLQGP